MTRSILVAIAAVAFMGTAPPMLAQAADQAAAEKRLEEAKQRLEAAAREVAELAAEAGGADAARIFEVHVPGPRRAMLGINLGATEPNVDGVKVNTVSPGGPAAEAGVQAEDVIVAIDGKPVGTGRDLVAAMKGVEPGQKVALDLRRDGKPLKLTVVARAMDRAFLAGPGMDFPGHPAMRPFPPMPPMEGRAFAHGPHWLLQGWSDAELVTMTPALGRYFGAEKGVLVARAPTDAALGLQDGDVIIAIDGREPQSGPHAMRILRSYQPGETVELRILRDRKAQTVKAVVPEHGFDDAAGAGTAPRPPTPAPARRT